MTGKLRSIVVLSSIPKNSNKPIDLEMNFLEEKIISDGVIKEGNMDFETQTIHFRDNR